MCWQVELIWLANGIPEEVGYMCWLVELMWLANDIPEEIGYMAGK